MKKRHLFKLLFLVALIPSLTVVEALPSVSILESLNTFNMPLAFKAKPVAKKLHFLGLTMVCLQLSSSMSLHFDYATVKHSKTTHLEPKLQAKGFNLGLQVRF